VRNYELISNTIKFLIKLQLTVAYAITYDLEGVSKG
jgi:hypothetical protein